MARSIVITLALFFSVILATTSVATPPGEDDQIQIEKSSQIEFLKFQQLVNRTLRWRTDALAFYEHIKNQGIYSNQDILAMHEQGTKRYFRIRSELLQIIDKLEWITDENVDVIIVSHPTKIITETDEAWESLDGEPIFVERTHVLLNPLDAKGQQYIKSSKIGLAAALLLYDNYLLAISNYNDLKKTRRLINYDNSQISNYLDTVTKNYLNLNNYHRTARALDLFEKERKWEEQNKTHIDQNNEYLGLLIEGSYTYKRISQRQSMGIMSGNIERFATSLSDTLDNAAKTVTYTLVESFSKVIGLVETRKGKMATMSRKNRLYLAGKLQPLDILLEKTPFRLTDKTIPGYWGHVGIWIGNREELETLGIWDHPLIQPYQEDIDTGKRRIIEALLPGVQINTLEHFLNIDDLAVLRPTYLSLDEKKCAILRAFSQVGKEYDYNFDVETDKRIVCSEIAYVVYNSLDWETETMLGRATISPDNVARFAENSGRFQTALLYLAGQAVQGELDQEMKALLGD